MDYDKLINLATDIGFRLLGTGAEVYRVEESVQRILRAYGVSTGEVFAIPNCIIVSMVTPSGRTFTRVRRMADHGTDIDRLEQYNTLCRHLCAEPPPLEEALVQLNATEAAGRSYSLPAQALAYFFGAALFCLFFGGTALDGLCAGLCGLAAGGCLTFLARLGTNLFFKTVAGGAVSALVALGLTLAGLGRNVDLITIGALMLLVPGLIFTNAMRDIIAGDMVTGLSKTAEALLIGAAIALGTGTALWLARLLWGGGVG
ncbi:MAG TPA: threonine/serine exporter family protein [Pseudoflavonifractor sp.]|nr:threonine/serine exporter family protein [Pseudoflavonifractor sp.]